MAPTKQLLPWHYEMRGEKEMNWKSMEWWWCGGKSNMRSPGGSIPQDLGTVQQKIKEEAIGVGIGRTSICCGKEKLVEGCCFIFAVSFKEVDRMTLSSPSGLRCTLWKATAEMKELCQYFVVMMSLPNLLVDRGTLIVWYGGIYFAKIKAPT